MTSTSRPAGTARKLLLAVAAIVVAETLAFVVLAVLGVVQPSSDHLGVGIGTGLFLVVYGVAQAWAAWKVLDGEAWARSPLVVTHLILLLLAWNLRHPDARTGDTRWVAAALAIAGVVVLACLLAPPVTRALRGPDPV